MASKATAARNSFPAPAVKKPDAATCSRINWGTKKLTLPLKREL